MIVRARARLFSKMPARAISGVLLLAAFVALLFFTYGAGPQVLFQRALKVYAFAEDHLWLLPCLYILRLPLLLPASLVLLVTGMVCGPLKGEFVGVIGLTLSGSLEFLLVRGSLFAFLRPTAGPLNQWKDWLQRAPFHSILTMRLCLIPFDVVNIASALAQAPFRAFATATVLGVTPTSLPIIIAGASVDVQAWSASGKLWPGEGVINWSYVGLSLALAAVIALHARRSTRLRK